MTEIANTFFRAGEHRALLGGGRLPQAAHRARRAQRASQIETWGRGIQRIFAACKAAGSPKPKLRYEPNDLWLDFPFSKKYLEALDETSEKRVGEKVGERVGERVGETPVEKLDEKLGKNRAKIIRLLRENPKITVTALSEQLEISRNAVHNNIKILDELGWVKRIGPAKGGHWEVLK